MLSSVRTVSALTGGGASRVVECGPGGVLAGLVKRIEKGRDTQVFSLDGPDTINAALAAVAS